MQPIQSIGIPPLPPTWSPPASANAPAGGPSFKEMLLSSIERARAAAPQAAGSQPQESLTSLKQAQQTLKTMTEVRDRVMGAYQEIKDLHI